MSTEGMIHIDPVVIDPTNFTLNGKKVTLPLKPAAAKPGRELRIWDMDASQHLMAEAKELSEAGSHEEALLKLEEAIELDKEGPEAHEVKAATLQALGRTEEAVAASAQAERLRAPDGHRSCDPAEMVEREARAKEAAAAVPDSTMKVMQAAVMVAALKVAKTTEEAAETAAGLGELGREAHGGVEALLEAEAITAVHGALQTHGSSGALTFLALALLRLASQGPVGKLDLNACEGILAAGEGREEEREVVCSLCMVCQSLSRHPEGRSALAAAGSGELLLRALQSLPADEGVAQCVLSALLAMLCATRGAEESAGIPAECCLVSGFLLGAGAALEGHPECKEVQLQALRAIAVLAQCGEGVAEAEVWRSAHSGVMRALRSQGIHEGQGEAKLAAAGLAALGSLSRQLGSLKEADVAMARAALGVVLSEGGQASGGSIVEGLQLLTAGVAAGAAGDDIAGVVVVVVQALHMKQEACEVVMGALVALGRIVRQPGAREAALEAGALPAVTGAMASHLQMPQVQGMGLKVIMEFAQADAKLAASRAAMTAGQTLLTHQSHPGVAADAIFALFLMSAGFKQEGVWEDGLKAKVVVALEAVIATDDDDDMLKGDAEAVRDALV